MMIEKIISGGQSGVDRAALDIAIEMGIPHGGACPKERMAEDGRIDDRYQLEESTSSDPAERTIKNIHDSDGTIVIGFQFPLAVRDGTILTLSELKSSNKPYLKISLDEDIRANTGKITAWAAKNNIRTLNIAGPRESSCPGIYSATYKLLQSFLL